MLLLVELLLVLIGDAGDDEESCDKGDVAPEGVLPKFVIINSLPVSPPVIILIEACVGLRGLVSARREATLKLLRRDDVVLLRTCCGC